MRPIRPNQKKTVTIYGYLRSIAKNSVLEAFSRSGFIPLDRQSDQQLSSLPISSHLMLKGYPIERGQAEEADWSLTNKSYLTDGRYVGADDRPGLHHVRYFPGNHPIKDHDGMCGAPWIVRSEGEWEAMLAGGHVEGGRAGDQEYMGIFIGADVLIETLAEIQ
jgi:hypothetical protein